ncbi:MAG: Fis family transcriptional regulator [Chromatocurvus sp.]
MRKTDKKKENAIRIVLTEACEIARGQYLGFEWLTHFADYDNFPDSVSVACIYDTNANLANTDKDSVRALIREKLSSIDIKIRHAQRQVSFDTEENCQINHSGSWHERFS